MKTGFDILYNHGGRTIHRFCIKSTFMVFVAALSVLFSPITRAQVYPVQVSVSTTPPYYNFLAHYGDQNNHLLIIATLTDFSSPPVNVRLRLKIEGPGFAAQTRTDMPVGNVFQLSPGLPVFIQGSDVLPLLQENALTITSGNPDFNNLPEGFTTICVEVVEDNANAAVLATNNCTAFFLQLMQPPQPFVPVCNSVVDTSAVFQSFQWSPPQNYIPAIETDLNYVFSLYEWIDTTNYNIFQSGQGLVYQTQTQFPMVQVSNFDLAWQQGRKYVWRVQAQITSNGLPVQMVTNNGISAPCSFYYGQPQTLAQSLTDGLVINATAEAITNRKGLASWTVVDQTPNEGLSTYARYIVEYRKKPVEGDPDVFPWHFDTVTGFQLPIYQVEAEKTYQVRVSGLAGNFRSEPSTIAEFTTPPARQYACGEADLPYLPNNYQPLLSAHMGDVFQIGQFALEVTDILPLGTAGHYKGRGTIPHGFIGGARIKVRFDDLLVDSEYNVREGQASAVTDGVDDWLNDLYLDQAGVDTTIAGIIESGGFLNDSTVFVVVGDDSLFFTFNGDLPIVIHGGDNVEYQFWPDGTMIVTTYGVVPSNDNLQATKNLLVRFEPASGEPAETNSFDKKEYAQFSSGYEAISCQTGSPDQFIYFVPNKSKALTGTAQVKAVVHANTAAFVPSELGFRVAGSGEFLQKTQINDSTYLLTLPERNSHYALYAVYDELKLGKLNVKCYSPITKKVTIVPLVSMNLTEAEVETALNNIYRGANLTIDATIAPQFNTAVFTSGTQFTNPDVNLMSKYTTQMRALRDAYLSAHEVESGTYLLFIVPSFSNPQLDGYMVRGRGVGFVAQNTLTSLPAFAHTVAHELGHGIGALEHAWGETESLKGTTDNLMDYSGGTRLVKQQWEGLRNPAPVLSFLDGEEDGSSVSMYMSEISSLADPDGTYTFIALNGMFVSLPADTKMVEFSTMDRFVKEGTDIEIDFTAPIGSLISFTDKDDNIYKTDLYGRFRKTNATGQFIGSNYIDSISLTKQPTLGITCFFSVNNGEFNTTVFKAVSPIGQTTFSTTNYPKALDKFIIFEPEGADRSQSITDYIEQYHVGSGIYLNDANVYFANSDIPISFTNGSEDLVGKTISNLEILDLNTDPYVSVQWLLKYLTLINSRQEDYTAFESCFESLNLNDVKMSKQFIQNKLASVVFQNSSKLSEANSELKDFKKKTVKELIESAYQMARATEIDEIEYIITSGSAEDIAGWIASHNACVLNGVTVEKRVLAFHKLLLDDNYWSAITPLLASIPEEINGASGTFLESSANYNGEHWLNVALPQLDNWNGDVADLSAMFNIGVKLKQIIQQNPTHNLVVASELTKTKSNILRPFETDEITYHAIDQPIYFVKNNANYNHVLNPAQQLAVNFTNSTNKLTVAFVNNEIVITQNYALSDGTPSFAPAGSNWNEPVSMYVEMNLKPYELVSIVFLDNFAEECNKNAGDEIVVPAYYLLLYQQGIENDDFWDEINTITDGIVFVTEAAIALTTAPMTFGGSLAIFGASLAATNLIVAENREMATTQEINTYYKPWDNFYAIAGIVSTVGSIAVVSKQARMQVLLLQEASFTRRLVDVATEAQTKWARVKRILMGLEEYTNPILFHVGDQIAGKTIVQIRQGTNGKYAVVGRQMANHVNDVASQLQNEGKIVEILNDDYLNYSFNIEGQEWTVNSAWNDMVTNPNYDNYKDVNGFITAEYIELIPMYKVNKKWVEKIVNEGFTIIDIGYPQGLTTESLFYNMEISTINW